MMIRIEKYGKQKKTEWDSFIKSSNCSSFLFFRDYMDYHSERFTDHSLMIYLNDVLFTLLPANLESKTLYSHQGLTYGGFIYNSKMKAAQMLLIFEATIHYLNKKGIVSFIYKKTPQIYNTLPADEDLYALYRNDATLIKRDISSTIDLKNKLPFSKLRKRMVNKARRELITVNESESLDTIYPILTKNLANKHGVTPVHTQNELNLLKSRFEKNIRFFSAENRKNETIAGVIVYECQQTIHVQYICSLDEGRNVGALDIIFDYLINEKFTNKTYFDFGISTENNGLTLNEGLIAQKEMFGGRGICYDTYEVKL